MRYFLLIISVLFITACKQLQPVPPPQPLLSMVETTDSDASEWGRPKLMVGIVIDQLRYDYIERYWEDFGEDGFKKIVNDGFYCRDHHFGYAPTYTGPGHASIYTGTTPAVHGIIGNNWYLKDDGIVTYCTTDSTVNGVGVDGYDGEMSPHYLLSSTITDELRMFSNMRSKVIAMSMKDRGAILPGGHMANAAYWFVGKKQGEFVSSSYYMDKLPNWVEKFNDKKLSDKYLASGWNLLLDESAYDESLEDNNPYEAKFSGLLRPTFPYGIDTLGGVETRYEMIKATPAGNSILTDFAIEALEAEGLGTDRHTDFLCVSYSSTDYVGHQFGTMAMETQDIYLRLDQDISRLLNELDSKIGEGNYSIFLTADHGAVTNPSYVKDNGGKANYYSQPTIKENIEAGLSKRFGNGSYIINMTNDQLFLNHKTLKSKKIDAEEVMEEIVTLALIEECVQLAMTREELTEANFTTGHQAIVQNGWSQKSSGDVVLVMRPGWIEYGPTGTTHGSPYAYDTHVPLLFYGANVPQGHTYKTTYIRDIAPTVAGLLRIQMPNGTTGKPINEVLKVQ